MQYKSFPLWAIKLQFVPEISERRPSHDIFAVAENRVMPRTNAHLDFMIGNAFTARSHHTGQIRHAEMILSGYITQDL